MGVLLPNYPQDMVVKGENVSHFSKVSDDQMRAPTGQTNVFQIFGDIQKQQAEAVHSHSHSQCEHPESGLPFRTTTPSENSMVMTAMATGIQANNFPVHAHIFPIKTTS